MRGNGIPLHSLAWTAALLPFLTVHISYLLAASLGHVDWCLPYWDACTSISATGRQLPEKLVFKLGMIPAGLVTALLWWALHAWLRHDDALAGKTIMANFMLVVGVAAAFFLVLYTIALGEEGETYQRIRRIGITLSFTFTYLAQLLGTHLLGIKAVLAGEPRTLVWQRRLLVLVVLLLATGLLSVILDGIMGPAYDDVEDAFEWVLALMLNGWFAGLALYLAPSGARLGVRPG